MAGSEGINDGETLTVRIPLRLRKRGGRKLVLAPDGTKSHGAPACRHVDSALVKAIARAHRWRRLLEGGEYALITELAAAEKINQSYICRILRLTLLAPDIIEAALKRKMVLEKPVSAVLNEPLPIEWDAQRTIFEC